MTNATPQKGQLIVLSGPSGVGKDTVAKFLADARNDVTISVSRTARPPRPGEENGREYFFVSKEEFEAGIARDEFLEYATYNQNYYGTPKTAVEELLLAGQHVIVVIEVAGAQKIRDLDLGATLVFLMPPSWASLRRRLTGRGTESAEAIASRLTIAREEVALAQQYDYVIINDAVEDCADKLYRIMQTAGYRAQNQYQFIEEVLQDAQTIHVSDY